MDQQTGPLGTERVGGRMSSEQEVSGNISHLKSHRAQIKETNKTSNKKMIKKWPKSEIRHWKTDAKLQ